MKTCRRLSLNQITVPSWSVEELVEACERYAISVVSLWRDRVQAAGIARTARLLEEADVRVSGLCRGGFMTGSDEALLLSRESNRAAIEEAATLSAECLVMVCGPPRTKDLGATRAQIASELENLVPHARAAGVKLAIEPLHPMMIGERSAIVTLDEATRLACCFDPADVGVIVDAYHVWWDPQLEAAISRAAGRILGYHVSDWLVPTTNLLRGRGMMGDGIIDLPTIRSWVERAGYDGPIEVEIISDDLEALDGDAIVKEIRKRFADAV